MAITINGDGLIAIGGTTTTQGRVRLAEDADNGSNYVEITAPASVAANRVITFPDADTTVVGTDAVQTLTNKTLTAPTISGGTASSVSLTTPTLTSPTISGTPVVDGSLIVLGTSQAATGTSVDFTGIPPWVKRITVMFQGVSTSGGSGYLIQLGTGSATYVTSGYLASSSSMDSAIGTTAFTAGFGVRTFNLTYITHGNISITNITGNSWTANGNISIPNVTASAVAAGSITLGAALTAVRVITGNGTDTFDAGTINIMYE